MKAGILFFLTISMMSTGSIMAQKTENSKPNIILIMADDLGWGDVGFNGNPVIKTPELDKMAANSLQFTRFYAAAPVCSPTRGSCITGRNPERYGIYFANEGHLKHEEVTLAEVLATQGYTTGHFGKWHLGTLTQTIEDGRRGGREHEQYAPPWENGFDVCFSTEQAVPTWDPMKNQPIPTKYWTGPDAYAKDNLDGDDSRVIMDRAIPFIENAVHQQQPFFMLIWFHAPHSPVIAGKQYRELYENFDENHQHYFGCITALDEQMGRLRSTLSAMNVEENTMLIFASDNGPAGEGGGIAQHAGQRQQGSTGLFRGRKGSLYEGGIRVPALLEWPGRFNTHRKINIPLTTSDYYPTILSLLGFQPQGQPHPLDGIDFMPLIQEEKSQRPTPIALKSRRQRAYMDNQFKIYSADDGQHYEIYDLLNDPYEMNDLAASKPALLDSMKKALEEWIVSCEKSATGADY